MEVYAIHKLYVILTLIPVLVYTSTTDSALSVKQDTTLSPTLITDRLESTTSISSSLLTDAAVLVEQNTTIQQPLITDRLDSTSISSKEQTNPAVYLSQLATTDKLDATTVISPTLITEVDERTTKKIISTTTSATTVQQVQQPEEKRRGVTWIVYVVVLSLLIPLVSVFIVFQIRGIKQKEKVERDLGKV